MRGSGFGSHIQGILSPKLFSNHTKTGDTERQRRLYGPVANFNMVFKQFEHKFDSQMNSSRSQPDIHPRDQFSQSSAPHLPMTLIRVTE